MTSRVVEVRKYRKFQPGKKKKFFERLGLFTSDNNLERNQGNGELAVEVFWS